MKLTKWAKLQDVTYRTAWQWFKDGKMDYITLDADIPHEQKILITLTTMRMSDGNNSKREGSSPS